MWRKTETTYTCKPSFGLYLFSLVKWQAGGAEVTNEYDRYWKKKKETQEKTFSEME